jgi:hypothetical protein
MELFFSIVLMVAVVGTLAGWAFREDRRRRQADNHSGT